MDNPERVTYFGATDTRGKRTPFGIKSKDRDRHMYVIGKTGMGKSTLLENMAIQDLRNGEGLAFIDPHGGTADKLLDYIPKNRIKDVVYFAPFDLDQPIAFNVMEDVGYDKRHLVVSGLMATFKKIWEDAWSARMEYILTNTLLALLEYPNATLLGVNKMYTDKAYRKKVVDNLKDPVVKDFWTKEFANYGERYTQEATPAIQNKIGQFTGNPLIRNIIGQPKSSFDIRQMMDDKKILIINLSKGQVGETNMRLLGSMLTTRIFLSAMSRADLSGTDLARLPHFYFYVDEFQNFANDTFAEILSEARKYHLNLIIAHQYVEQMEEQVRAAVFGNVGTTIAFRVGPFDAETLETVFSPEFMKEDIVNLSIRQIYISLMIDGVGSRPFSAVTIPPIALPPVTYKKEVIEASRQQFGEKRAEIEAAVFAEISEDHGAKDAKEAKEAKEAESKEKESSASRESRPRVTSASTRSNTTDSTRSSSSPSRPTTTRSSSSNSGTNSSSANTAPRTNAASSQIRTPEPRRAMTASPQPERSTHIETRTERPAPKPAVQTSEDLKSILRAMTANNPPPAKPAVRPTAPLKDALAGVLKDTTPSQPTQGHSSTQTQQPTAAKSQKPFEVPEETLKALFKDQ